MFNMLLGETIRIDLNEDNVNDLLVQLKAINVPTLKATFYLENLGTSGSGGEPENETEKETEGGVFGIENIKNLPKSKILIIIIVLIAIPLIIWGLHKLIEEIKFRDLASRIKVKSFTPRKK